MLYLLPNLLFDLPSHTEHFPASVDAAVATLTGLIAENEKKGRHFLRRFAYKDPKTFRDIPIHQLNEHSTQEDKEELIKKIQEGGIWGLVSDCGMPCIADPGADFVLRAQRKGIPIQTFAGPSSILFALILSGLNAQHFTFHGYLPKDHEAFIQKIKQMQKNADATHVFIETPYRNVKLFHWLLENLADSTWLCLACDLSAPDQLIMTRKVVEWKKSTLPSIAKRPTVFVMRS